jgi:hypothetical protein
MGTLLAYASVRARIGRFFSEEKLAIAPAAAFASASAATTASPTSCLGFVDANRTSLDFPAIQFFDGAFRSVIGRHLDEAKTSRAIGRAIDDDLRAVHLSRLGENIEQVLIRYSPRQIANVQSPTHYALLARSNGYPRRKLSVLSSRLWCG